MLPRRELHNLPWTCEAVDALLNVEGQCSQFLLWNDMLQSSDLLRHLTDDQIIGWKVQDVSQRVPLDEVRVLMQELFIVDGLDWFQAALEGKERGLVTRSWRRERKW